MSDSIRLQSVPSSSPNRNPNDQQVGRKVSLEAIPCTIDIAITKKIYDVIRLCL